METLLVAPFRITLRDAFDALTLSLSQEDPFNGLDENLCLITRPGGRSDETVTRHGFLACPEAVAAAATARKEVIAFPLIDL